MLCLIPSTTFVLTPVASWTCAGGAEGGASLRLAACAVVSAWGKPPAQPTPN